MRDPIEVAVAKLSGVLEEHPLAIKREGRVLGLTDVRAAVRECAASLPCGLVPLIACDAIIETMRTSDVLALSLSIRVKRSNCNGPGAANLDECDRRSL